MLEYSCPECKTTNIIHERRCQFEGTHPHDIEKAYVDILSCLTAKPYPERDLKGAVHGNWNALRESILDQLKYYGRIQESESGELVLLTPAEYHDQVVPTSNPLKTVYQRGSVPGCHDNAVFAMIAWFEYVGLTWEDTRERVLQWVDDTGTWERGGFSEASPEELVDGKKHVYDEGYGWKEKGKAAKAVIDSRLNTPETS